MDVEQDGDMDFISHHNNSYFILPNTKTDLNLAYGIVSGSNIQPTHFDFNGD